MSSEPVTLRPEVMELVADPESVTLKGIWKAMPEQVRTDLVVYLLSMPGLGGDYADMLNDDLKGIRKSALLKDPKRFAPLLTKNPALHKHLWMILRGYLIRDEFRFFLPSIAPAEDEEEGAKEHGEGGLYDPAKVGPTASRMLSAGDPQDIAICLLIVRTIDPVLREEIDPWLTRLDSEGVEELLAEGEQLLEEDRLVDPAAPPEWDLDEAEGKLETLEQELGDLARRMEEAAESIRDEELLVTPAFVERVTEVEDRYQELAEMMGLGPGRRDLVPEMRRLIGQKRGMLHHSEETRETASMALSLSADSDLLADVRTEAEALLTALDQDPMEPDTLAAIDAVASGRHPLLDVLRLALVRDGLSRDQIHEASKRIGEAYGPAVPVDILTGQVNAPDDLIKRYVDLDRDSWQMLPDDFSKPQSVTDTTDEQEQESPKSVPDEEPEQSGQETDTGDDTKTGRVQPPEESGASASEAPDPEAATSEEAGATEGILASWGNRRRARAVAAELRDAVEPGTRDRLLEELIVVLAAESRFALAAHLNNKGSELLTVPLWLLKALALAPHVKTSVGPVESALRDSFALFAPDPMDLGGEWERGLSLLNAAAALRPALLAPTSLAFTALEKLHFPAGMEETYALCEKIRDNSKRGRYLDRTVLGRALDVAAQEEVLEEVRLDAEQWLRDGPRRTLLYAGATDVWRTWNQEGGLLYRLLDPVRRDDEGEIRGVRSRIEGLSRRGAVADAVNETYRELRSSAHPRDIEARALRQIEHRTDDAKAIAQRWIDYHETGPGQPGEERVSQSKRLHHELSSLVGAALSEVEEQRERDNLSLLEGTGMRALGRTVEDLEGILSEPERLKGPEPDPLRSLNAPLLQVSAVVLDADWEVVNPTPETRQAIVDALAEGLPSLRGAYETRVALHDHVGADFLLDALREVEEVDPEEITRLEEDRPRRIRQSQATLRREADLTREKIEQAVMQGLLTETERAAWMAPVDRAERLLERGDEGPFRPIFEGLKPIGQVLEQKRSERLDKLESRLRKIKGKIDDRDADRVVALMEQGDVFTAEEFVGLLESGQALPPGVEADDRPDPFASFFPDLIRRIDEANLGSRHELADKIRSRKTVGPIALDHLDDGQIDRTADVIAKWFRASRHPGNPVKDLGEEVFRFVGFNVQEVAITERSRQSWMTIVTDPVRDRARCPVPLFGSMAAGHSAGERAHYRVLWLWDELSADDLLGAVGDTANTLPTFVFYLNRMGEQRRRSLARLSRERRRTFVVLDEDVLLRLAAEVDARMPLLFALTLPFTHLEPYVTTAGDVPPELFFGRDSERREIIDTAGSSFVYGGRQLGKTALLRHVQRYFDDPRSGQIALFIDLVAQGIGIAREPEELWPILVNEFRDRELVDPKTPPQTGPEALLRQVEHWLDEDGRRRVLLLLDEADRFFETDTDFQVVSHLKGLMDRTNRRFKVVFSGLHNVQRMTRISNNPLVHLGRPIVIGPLYNGEWTEARGLLQEPLESLGFRFQSSELLTRLLSHTNYFPSLIQLTGRYLLRRLTRKNVEVFDPATAPPYVITREHVDEVARDPDLRNELRNRFLWTLDLDKRYRLIAFVMAERAIRAEHGEATLTPAEIRRLVLDWWPRGFQADSSEDAIRVLLDEMEDLRVLRRTEDGKYALLNENIVLLLGTEREIEEELINMQDEEPLPAFRPAMHRRPAQTGDADAKRSPLTSEQEGRLLARGNGVALVFGHGGGGIHDVQSFLEEAPVGHLEVAPGDTDLEDFEDLLARTIDARAREGVTALLVSLHAPWTMEWVDAAQKRLARLQSPNRWLRVIMLADPERTWSILEERPDFVGGAAPFDSVSLGPWNEAMVARWLDGTAMPANSEILSQLRDLTGLWPLLLYGAHRHLREAGAGQWKEALEAFARTWEDETVVGGRAAKFGVEVLPESQIPALLTPREGTNATPIPELLGVPEDLVERTLAWLDRMRLATRAGDNSWRADSILPRLL